MNQIILTLRAINWTEGDVGHVALLMEGGSCMIDWGDGHSQMLRTSGRPGAPQWCGASHPYPSSCKASGLAYNVIISSDDDNIIGINAASGDMNVDDVDIRSCQSIRHFSASFLINHFDLCGNPGIETVDLRGEACGIADFSGSVGLKALSFCYTSSMGKNMKRLDLSKCNELEYLECHYAHGLTDIVISNRSTLKKLVYDDNTPLSDRTLRVVRRIIERNGGEIIRELTDY